MPGVNPDPRNQTLVVSRLAPGVKFASIVSVRTSSKPVWPSALAVLPPPNIVARTKPASNPIAINRKPPLFVIIAVLITSSSLPCRRPGITDTRPLQVISLDEPNGNP